MLPQGVQIINMSHYLSLVQGYTFQCVYGLCVLTHEASSLSPSIYLVHEPVDTSLLTRGN